MEIPIISEHSMIAIPFYILILLPHIKTRQLKTKYEEIKFT